MNVSFVKKIEIRIAAKEKEKNCPDSKRGCTSL